MNDHSGQASCRSCETSGKEPQQVRGRKQISEREAERRAEEETRIDGSLERGAEDNEEEDWRDIQWGEWRDHLRKRISEAFMYG